MRQPGFTIEDEIERYLATGESDAIYSAWSGGIMERARSAHKALRGALVERIRELSAGWSHHACPDIDTVRV